MTQFLKSLSLYLSLSIKPSLSNKGLNLQSFSVYHSANTVSYSELYTHKFRSEKTLPPTDNPTWIVRENGLRHWPQISSGKFVFQRMYISVGIHMRVHTHNHQECTWYFLLSSIFTLFFFQNSQVILCILISQQRSPYTYYQSQHIVKLRVNFRKPKEFLKDYMLIQG